MTDHTVDYEEILTRYIAHVLAYEGVDFIDMSASDRASARFLGDMDEHGRAALEVCRRNARAEKFVVGEREW